MILGALLGLLAIVSVLVLATAVQTCYLESLRFRRREQDVLRYFEEHIEKQIGVPDEVGAVSFSVSKHALMVLVPIPLAAIAGNLALTAVYSLLAMFAFAYMIPQYLYRRTTGAWLGAFLPLLRPMVLAAKPVISLLKFMKTVSEFGEGEPRREEKTDEVHALRRTRSSSRP